MDLAAVMDAVAVALKAGGHRAYAYPADSVNVPAAVVGYPTDLDLDVTFGGNTNRVVLPIYYLVGKASERSARNKLSEVLAGAAAFKTLLDGNLSGAVQSLDVRNVKVEEINVGAIPYLSATFEAEIYS